MDNQAAPIASPSAGTGQDTPPKKRHGCFYYGCLTTVVLVIVAVGGFAFLFYYGNTSVTPVVEEFLTAAEGGQYDHAYAMLANEWKEKITRDEFPALFKLVHDTLGSRQSLSMRGINLQTATSGTVARADYAATYEKGEADLTFNLKKYDGQWRVVSLFYNSPKLVTALKCPNCGAVNSFDAKFCAKCGKPLHQEKEKGSK
jgi:ribosomal protein L40E